MALAPALAIGGDAAGFTSASFCVHHPLPSPSVTYFQAVLLGLVQGVTEFLPISSSAHLILTSHWLGWEDQGLAFDMAVHLGSMVAVVAYLRSDLAELARSLVAGRDGKAADRGRRLALLLAVATIPVAVAGWFGRDFVATSLRLPLVIAVTSIGLGLALFAADRLARRFRSLESLTTVDALVIGAAQALALVPGTSRAGVTMTAGLALGLERTAAARFSFLLALPVSTLVAARQAFDLAGSGPHPASAGHMAVGFLVAAVSAYAAMGALIAWVRKRDFSVFVVYRVLLGFVILAALAA